jgi:hypothetical protein
MHKCGIHHSHVLIVALPPALCALPQWTTAHSSDKNRLISSTHSSPSITFSRQDAPPRRERLLHHGVRLVWQAGNLLPDVHPGKEGVGGDHGVYANCLSVRAKVSAHCSLSSVGRQLIFVACLANALFKPSLNAGGSLRSRIQHTRMLISSRELNSFGSGTQASAICFAY